MVESDVESLDDVVKKMKVECSKASLDECSFDENDKFIPTLISK